MAKCISFGQFNKKYFFILGSLIVWIIITFITGFTPYLTPNNSLFIFGFSSNIFSHPMITYCFQYFSLCLGGIILELIFWKKNKEKNGIFSIKLDKTDTFHSSSLSTNYIFNDKNKQNDLKYFLEYFSFIHYIISQKSLWILWIIWDIIELNIGLWNLYFYIFLPKKSCIKFFIDTKYYL